MTTMDSDSASQDSDEGRRFRFEATRKDGNSRYDSGRSRASPRERERSRRRSRSRDRGHRQKRDESRSRDRKRGSRDEREKTGPGRRGESPKHRRDERNHERRHSSHDERRERIHRRPRDSREAEKKRRRSENKMADSPEVDRKKSSREKNEVVIDDSRSFQDCQDLNLSDFDIVSDTAEHSSGESRRSDDSRKKMTKRHYERMLERRATKKRRRDSEETGDGERSRSRNGDEPEPEVNGSSWGPVLPPAHLSETPVGKEEIQEEVEKRDKKIIGPVLPENFVASGVDEDDSAFGPALPPHLTSEKSTEQEPVEKMADEPASGSDDDFLGPLPIDHPAMQHDLAQKQLEMRARRLKAEIAACDKEEEKKREEWMTELPPEKSTNLGLGPRKFRIRPGPDMSDRSSWTDTPADKARKRMEKLENKNVEPSVCPDRSRKDESESGKARKKEKSLLEIHQKKMHKKKKKEEKQAKKSGKTTERRPFDRDIDLQANRFDQAKKKSFLLSASKLDDRFSRGKI